MYLCHLQEGLVDTAGEGWMGSAGRSGFTHTHYHMSNSSRDAVAQHRELGVVLSDDLQRRNEVRTESVYVRMHTAGSPHCTAATKATW